MWRLPLLLVLVSMVTGDNLRTTLGSPAKLSAMFKSYLSSHHRHYTNDQLKFRLKIFRDGVREVADCNEEQSYRCAVNQFTDLTPLEREKFLGLKNVSDLYEPPSVPRPSRLSSATSYDWRDHGAVTEVKNQGDCGSCYAFSAVGSLEGAYKISTGKLKDFSEQEILDCTYEAIYNDYDACKGGWYYDSWDYVRRSRHLSVESDYPYVGKDNKCNKKATNSLTEGFIRKYVSVKAGDDNLANAVAITPTSVAMIFAGTAFHYKQGVYDGLKDCKCEYDPTNHALVAVAYTPETFTIKNSWGDQWGEQGYIRITRGANTCRVSDYVYYPVVRRADEPTQEPPTFVPTPSPDCMDSNPNCQMWFTWGECYNNPAYMLKYCARSCHQCICGDNHEKCEYWASTGECTANPDWMRVQCRKACKVCSDDKPTPKPTPGPSPGPTPEPTPRPDCLDKKSDCPDRAARGECYTAHSWDQIFKECPRSCHQCSCEDNHESCKSWADGGSCSANPSWMLKQCRKSCGVCKSGECKDKSSDCPRLHKQGECYNYRPWKDIFDKCPKSCNVCACGDNFPDCKEFAERGDCDTHPDWMMKQCKKSCRFCA